MNKAAQSNLQHRICTGPFTHIIAVGLLIQAATFSRAGDPLVGSWKGATATSRDVAISGNYAYVADSAAGMDVIDISDPAMPVKVGNYNSPGDCWALAVSGNYAYVADGTEGLHIVDVSNPANPTFVSKVDVNASGVAIVGNIAYVSDEGEALFGDNTPLHIVDISNPAMPVVSGTFETPSWSAGIGTDIEVVNGLAYLAANNSGIFIIDVSNPGSPSQVGQYNTAGIAYDVTVIGNRAYVADGGNGVVILDISNPASPSLLGTYDTPSLAIGIEPGSNPNTVVVADFASGVWVLDVTDPTQVGAPGHYDNAADAYNVTVTPTYTFVPSSGLDILSNAELSGPTLPSLSVADVTVTEGDTGTVSADFVVTLSAASATSVSFDYTTADDTATAGEDYVADTGTVTIDPGNLTATISIQVNGDTAIEVNETFKLQISMPTGATVADGEGIGTILNDDVEIEPELVDYGDAPDNGVPGTYPTTRARNGARHAIVPNGPYLGQPPDSDNGTLQDATATADDNFGGDDEDGVTFLTPGAVGDALNLRVVSSGDAKLDAWFDFNADGDWSDPGEQVFTSEPLVAGNNDLTVNVPLDATPGFTFSRFRVSTAGGLSFDGLAPDGEVEDYQVAIAGPPFMPPLYLPGGTSILLTWPITSTVFQLERAISLTDPQWEPVTGEQVQGGQYQIQIPIAPGNYFYRLKIKP